MHRAAGGRDKHCWYVLLFSMAIPSLSRHPLLPNLALAPCSTIAPRAQAACFRSLTRAKANACSCHNGSSMLKMRLCSRVHTWGGISVNLGRLLLIGCCMPAACASFLLAGPCAGTQAFSWCNGSAAACILCLALPGSRGSLQPMGSNLLLGRG